jgi:hypothetical protein
MRGISDQDCTNIHAFYYGDCYDGYCRPKNVPICRNASLAGVPHKIIVPGKVR